MPDELGEPAEAALSQPDTPESGRDGARAARELTRVVASLKRTSEATRSTSTREHREGKCPVKSTGCLWGHSRRPREPGKVTLYFGARLAKTHLASTDEAALRQWSQNE
jgi:hypothetical protein